MNSTEWQLTFLRLEAKNLDAVPDKALSRVPQQWKERADWLEQLDKQHGPAHPEFGMMREYVMEMVACTDDEPEARWQRLREWLDNRIQELEVTP